MQSPRLSEILTKTEALTDAFSAQGRQLYLVGGAVRDLLVQGESSHGEGDLDFTTDARPDEIESIIRPLASAVWAVGKRFGTIAFRMGVDTFEVTTHRSESYVEDSRKPIVSYSDSIIEDLSRRDFTINAMAIRLTDPAGELIDPYGGIQDLVGRRLMTPLAPEISFSEDPLRILRAARFLARFDLEPDPMLAPAILRVKDRLTVVSSERIQEELSKLLLVEDPSKGLWFLIHTTLMDQILPEVSALALEQDPIHRHKDVLAHTVEVVRRASPSLTLRLAALLHDIGKPATRQVGEDGVTFHFHDVVGARMARKVLRRLKYSNDLTDDVARLVELHLRFHTYGSGWSDSAVRRYVRDAGTLLPLLNELTICDATTRNEHKIRMFKSRMEELEARVRELEEQERLDAIRPELNGEDVMKYLHLQPSREVGEALAFLLDVRMEEGLIGREAALERLSAWWIKRQNGEA
jgi:poly(A) polymerase